VLSVTAGMSRGGVRATLLVLECLLLGGAGWKLRQYVRLLARERDWYRSLVETSAAAVAVVDGAGLIISANARMAELAGAEPSAMVGARMEDFFFEADRPVERIRLGNHLAGMREQFDRRLRSRDGSEIWVLAAASALPADPGSRTGVLSVMTEITERKRAEQALRLSEAQFRSQFENAQEGVYRSTPDGRLLAANPVLLRMLGIEGESELETVDIARDFYADPQMRAGLMGRIEVEGSLKDVELRLRRRDGRTLTVRGNARAVRGGDGAILHLEGTLTEVPGPAGAGPEPGGGDGSAPVARVLLLDSDPLRAALCRDMLERLGCLVVPDADPAGSADSVLPFDLLVLDDSCADSGLFGALRNRRPDLKVLFLSGYNIEDGDVHAVGQPGVRAFEGGTVGVHHAFLRKPFSADALGKMVRHLLGIS